MDVFLDSSFVIPVVIKTNKSESAREFFRNFTADLVASMTVYEESFFVGLRLIAERRLEIRNVYTLRDYVKKSGYNFAYDFIKSLHDVFSKIQVVHDVKDPEVVRDIAEKYRLLPNDALIAATCKQYGIKKIATFDDDFKRVDFLEVVEV